ncbi:MAG TPA: hypothetical protein VD886_12835 [Herpetosiphonaceae bacterium]|nr:hypothetical protein [Herpetosiphonaceae bacterium]
MAASSSPARFQPLTRGMRRMLFTASALVFAVGVPLFLLTARTDTFFAWTIRSPLTAAFLGAAYWASFVLEFLAAREKHWAYARCAVPAVVAFTGLTLIVTLIHIDTFHFDAPALFTRLGTWVWLAVYASVPVIMGALTVLQLREPGATPPREYPLPPWMRATLTINAALLILFGLALLIVPTAVMSLWPWALTPLTGRAIGAWLIGLGIAAGHKAWENDLLRGRPVMVSSVAFSVLQIIALLRYSDEPDWGQPTMWLYLLLLADFLAVGIGGLSMLRQTAQKSEFRIQDPDF